VKIRLPPLPVESRFKAKQNQYPSGMVLLLREP
jgi:hypothetical protein